MNVFEFGRNFGHEELQVFENFWLVYFLVDEKDEIVYVGKSSSTRFGERLRSHCKNKNFSRYFIKTGPRDEVEAYNLEGAFITLLRPKYNKANTAISAVEIKSLHEWLTGEMKADRPLPLSEVKRKARSSKMRSMIDYIVAGTSLVFFLQCMDGTYDISNPAVMWSMYLCVILSVIFLWRYLKSSSKADYWEMVKFFTERVEKKRAALQDQ